MTTPSTASDSTPSRSAELWLGMLLVAAGLLGHVLAALAIGGTRLAFRDHLAGFALILVVTGGLIAVAGRRFWPNRSERTWLIVGIVQALFGVYVYIERFNVSGH
jgi:hypothetical protein